MEEVGWEEMAGGLKEEELGFSSSLPEQPRLDGGRVAPLLHHGLGHLAGVDLAAGANLGKKDSASTIQFLSSFLKRFPLQNPFTSFGTSTHSSEGCSLGTRVVTCLQVRFGSRSHFSSGIWYMVERGKERLKIFFSRWEKEASRKVRFRGEFSSRT